MATPIALQTDFDGPGLRRLARETKDADQARRLLAPAAIDEGRRMLAFADRSAHAVPILDRAGWHMTPKLVVPANIT